MTEARDALGLDASVDEQLEQAARELSFDQLDRAHEICDLVLEALPADSDRRGLALYLRGLARLDDQRVEDLAAAVAELDSRADPVASARARLALARSLSSNDADGARRVYDEALERLVGEDLPIEHAEVLLGLARLAMEGGARGSARRRATEALERLRGVLRLEARRLEVLAIELQADAAEHAPEAIALLDDALALAERIDLGRARLRRKRDLLSRAQGPFR